MITKRYLFLPTTIFILVLGFQNCSDVGYSTQSQNANGGVPGVDNNDLLQDDIGLISESTGVDGGHFDLDTATQAYSNGNGRTNHHAHEYDDKYGTNTVDFFNLLDNKFDAIDSTFSVQQSFYLIVANADLSPRVALVVNENKYAVKSVTQPLGPFSISGIPQTTQLLNFKAIVATDAILNEGLVGTVTGCVRDNDFTADGRYRNGALVIQAIPASEINNINPSTGVASNSQGLLWESTIFWHHDGNCL